MNTSEKWRKPLFRQPAFWPFFFYTPWGLDFPFQAGDLHL